jgi:hypothetical protein
VSSRVLALDREDAAIRVVVARRALRAVLVLAAAEGSAVVAHRAGDAVARRVSGTRCRQWFALRGRSRNARIAACVDASCGWQNVRRAGRAHVHGGAGPAGAGRHSHRERDRVGDPHEPSVASGLQDHRWRQVRRDRRERSDDAEVREAALEPCWWPSRASRPDASGPAVGCAELRRFVGLLHALRDERPDGGGERQAALRRFALQTLAQGLGKDLRERIRDPSGFHRTFRRGERSSNTMGAFKQRAAAVKQDHGRVQAARARIQATPWARSSSACTRSSKTMGASKQRVHAFKQHHGRIQAARDRVQATPWARPSSA